MLGYVLSIWAVPASLSNFKQYQWEIRNRLAAFLLQDGVFTPLSDKLTVYVRSRDPDGTPVRRVDRATGIAVVLQVSSRTTPRRREHV